MSFLLNPPIPFRILRKRTSQFFGSPSPPLRLCGTAPGRSRSSSSESTYSGNLIRLNPGSPEQRKLRSVFFFSVASANHPPPCFSFKIEFDRHFSREKWENVPSSWMQKSRSAQLSEIHVQKKNPHGPEQQGNHRKPHGWCVVAQVSKIVCARSIRPRTCHGLGLAYEGKNLAAGT